MRATAATILALLLGCGGDTDEGAGQLPLDEAEAALAEARCQALVDCSLYATVADCVGTGGPGVARAVAAVLAGTADYDPAAAWSCREAIVAAGCTFISGAEPDVCDDVFIGFAVEGEPCGDSAECATDFCDLPCGPAECCTGTCAPAPMPPEMTPGAADGAPCDEAAEPLTACASLDHTCDPATATCVPRKRPGEPCTPGALGLSDCVLHASCESGQCIELPAAGEPCAPLNRCQGFVPCDADGLCLAETPGVCP